jgi:DNA-binding response OmpR family regulator
MTGVASLSGRRILVVEDEAMLAMMLDDTLSDAGGVVIGPAGTVKAALDLLGEEVVDCALLDVKLHDGNSVPVAEALAALGIPYVVTSGYDHIPEEYNNGARILRKVFMPEEVIEAIADVLRS